MSNVNYSLPEFCERREFVKFSPDQSFQIPVTGVQSQKNNITYTINDRSGIYDWAKGYFQCEFNLDLLVGGSTVPLVNNAGLINGINSIIKKISLYGGNGQLVYTLDNSNHAVHWKDLLEMSPDYADSVGTNELWYLDTGDTTANSGHQKRFDITKSRNKVNFKIPLSKYSYFKSLEFANVFLTGQQIRLIIDIDNDQSIIYSNAGNQRLIINKLDLMLPQLVLHADAYDSYIKSIETPVKWTFQRERIDRSDYQASSNSGRFKITGVMNPKKILFWFLNEDKIDKHTGNMHIADPFSAIGTGTTATLASCRLEFSNGQVYPRSDYAVGDNKTDVARLYSDVIEWSYQNTNVHSGSQLNRSNFENLFSCVYFDLSYKQRQLVSDARDMTFIYNLSGATATKYYVYALIIYEEMATFGVVNNQYTIQTESILI